MNDANLFAFTMQVVAVVAVMFACKSTILRYLRARISR